MAEERKAVERKIITDISADIDEVLKSKNIEILEETITGPAAVRFYKLLKNPPKDPEREKMIKDALRLFPEPNKPIKVDIYL